MTRADFTATISRMHLLVEEARKVANRVSATDLRNATLYGLSVSERAILAWETTQLNEVIAGTRNLERWVAYGVDLSLGLERIIQDAGSWSSQFSSLANWLGDAANSLLAPLESQVKELRKRVDEVAVQRKAWEKNRVELKDKALTDAARKTLFGADATAAIANCDTLGTMLVGLESGVSLLRTGKAKLVTTSDGKDVAITPLSGPAYMALGAVPLVAAGVTLGTVAAALAIAVSVKAYFGHAEQVARGERTRLALEATVATGGDVNKTLEQLNESDRIAMRGEFGDVLDGLKIAGRALSLGAIGWGAWKLWRATRARA